MQLAFPREGNPNFPWEKSHWDNTVVKKEKKKKGKKDEQRTVIKSGKKKERSGLSTQRYNLVVI